MAQRNEQVLQESFMTKRSQNKSPFTPTNWKDRWFVLTPQSLIYYDGDKQTGRKREKGRVELTKVVAVEKVDLSVFQREYVFQLVYNDLTELIVLYIAAENTTEQESWLAKLRELVAGNSCLESVYHSGVCLRGQWQCCKKNKDNTDLPGCASVTWKPTINNLANIIQPQDIIAPKRTSWSSSINSSNFNTNFNIMQQ
ncbi:unnamed protein product, partial [Meganyctiphanes norvegica]